MCAEALLCLTPNSLLQIQDFQVVFGSLCSKQGHEINIYERNTGESMQESFFCESTLRSYQVVKH